METNFECLWDPYRSIPSLEIEGASVLDEVYWLNKDDPNYSMRRTTKSQGEDGGTNGKLALTGKARMELVMAHEEDLYDKRINEVMGKDFRKSNFWLFWRTMFAYEE